MAYKIPEERRLTRANAKKWEYISESILELVSFENNKEDGYFWLPKVNATGTAFQKGAIFLCRASVVEGWRVVAVNIPSQGRSPSWEELHWVKSFFWDPEDVVSMFHPGKSTYVADNTFWLHLWQPINPNEAVPPLFRERYDFRKASFLTRLIRAIRGKRDTKRSPSEEPQRGLKIVKNK